MSLNQRAGAPLIQQVQVSKTEPNLSLVDRLKKTFNFNKEKFEIEILESQKKLEKQKEMDTRPVELASETNQILNLAHDVLQTPGSTFSYEEMIEKMEILDHYVKTLMYGSKLKDIIKD